MSHTASNLDRADLLEAIWHLECALSVFERRETILTMAELQSKTVLNVVKRELELQALRTRGMAAAGTP